MRGCFRYIVVVRSWFAVVPLLLALACLAVAPPALAAFDNTTPRGTFAGHHNYVVTGGTLRSQSNNGNACALNASSTATLSGIPAGSTILKAYLYWGGSGPTPDPNVTFNGAGVTADATFTDNFSIGGQYDLDYFGGFEDVTALVAGNGAYTFSGLTVATTDNYGGNNLADYCAPQAVVAGWALVVVYANPTERYRYTRVYDGLRFFRGSSVTTTQSGFRVPDLVDGKVTVVTWEGDPDANSSGSLDGFTESLAFDGNPLRNTACDASANIYNSTIGTPSSCSNTSYGVDIDTYNVTPYLQPGQTGATLEYSSGNDLVFLSTQVISTTNTPVADLGITKTHAGDFTAGQNGTFSIKVHNHGPEIATGTTTVTDTLPAGMGFVAGTGSGWSCSAAGQAVTCTSSITTLAVGADLPTLSLVVAVAGSAPASLQNTASVAHPMFDGTGGNQTATDTVAIRRSDLSGATKTVVDRNGGDADPGDVLRYTITLPESAGAAASGVRVTDDMPPGTSGFSIVSLPPGATDASTPTGGANGTGFLDIGNIGVPANGSVQVVFDVIIGALEPGALVDNSATVENGTGVGATPVAPTVTVSQSQVAANGNKLLYLYDNAQLTRTPQAATDTAGVTIGNGGNATWTLAPALAKDLVLEPGQVGVNLRLRCTGSGFGCAFGNQSTVVELRRGATVLATSAAQNVNNTAFELKTFALNLASAQTIPAGGTLSLRVVNNGGGWAPQAIAVAQYAGGGRSTVGFATSTVVNVDSVALYSAPYPATSQKTQFRQGDTLYVRAVVSDPFGGADASAATLRLTAAGGTVVVNEAAMAAKTTGAGGATRIFEGSYTIPANPRVGTWTARVTGIEGSELDGSGNPAVYHRYNASFPVHGLLTVAKAWGNGTAGDAVSLTVSGGSSTSAGSSVAGGASTQATATAAAGAVLSLAEAFTSGDGGRYSPSLACVRARDGVAVAVSGTGFARTVTMPNDSALACTWTNALTVPLTVVKTSLTYWDPVNGTSNPKAIPGALVTYLMIVQAPAQTAPDPDSIVVVDHLPPEVSLYVGDLPDHPGTSPILFEPMDSGLDFDYGGPGAGTDDVDFSDDDGNTWDYVPSAGSDGVDPAVDAIRFQPSGTMAPGAQVGVGFRGRVQ